MADDDQHDLFGKKLPAIRPLSRVERRLVLSSAEIEADDPDSILFQHTVFCQTGLPYRNPGAQVREWEREQGRVCFWLRQDGRKTQKRADGSSSACPSGPSPG